MMKFAGKFLVFVFPLLFLSCAYAEIVKLPNVAGTFYPQDKEELGRQLENFLTFAPKKNYQSVFGLVVPHAGFSYSGAVAAYAFKQIEGRRYDAVIILAPSHFYPLRGVSVFKSGAFLTPLGRILVDEEIAEKLLKLKFASFLPLAFEREHSVEVELPFVIKTLRKVKIVPVLFGQLKKEQIDELAEEIFAISKGKKILLIASSDLSHYYPYQQARKLDQHTLSFIRQEDEEGLWLCYKMGECKACGIYPLLTFIKYAKLKGAEIRLIYYANSGDTYGHKESVVGYGALAAVKKGKAFLPVSKYGQEGGKMNLDKEAKLYLLKLARQSIAYYLEKKDFSPSPPPAEILNQNCGAFVTLKENGTLRGCIGNLVADKPLYLTVKDMAVAAAVSDPRFPPLTKEALDKVEIEISVLSPLKQVKSAAEIVLGRDGVLLRQGWHQGVFLPQVAVETGWSKEEFLNNLCWQKAGLKADCWRDENTKIFTFTAEVFSEKDLKQ